MAAGISVQLAHDEDESDRAGHGWVRVIAEDKTVLAEELTVQHNRSYSQRKEMIAAMIDTVVAAVQGGGAGGGTKASGGEADGALAGVAAGA